MKTAKHSLQKIVTFLIHSDEYGGFWLPALRNEEQICFQQLPSNLTGSSGKRAVELLLRTW